MPLAARIIAVADVYQALSENRPYREGLPLDVVFGMMDQDAPHKLDRACVDALRSAIAFVSTQKLLTKAAGAR